MKGFFELLVADEVHEYKGRGSAQGIAAGVLADACGRSLTLTGTLSGGYSSTLFHPLYRFSPAIRTEFGRSEESRWIQRYGFEEHTIGKDDGDSVEGSADAGATAGYDLSAPNVSHFCWLLTQEARNVAVLRYGDGRRILQLGEAASFTMTWD